jgi:hypothetical protein
MALKRGGSFEDRMGFADPLDGDYSPAPHPSKTVVAKQPKPKLSKDEAAAKRASKKRSEASKMGNAVTKRKKFEASEPGQERLKQATDLVGHEHPGYSLRDIYKARGWAEHGPEVTGEVPSNLRSFPGMEHPHAAPQPRRWEEHTPKEQDRIQRAVKLKSGVDIDFMERSFGAQLDQSYLRAEKHHEPGEPVHPAGQDFYHAGEPRRVIERSAHHLGIPYGVHVAMNAFTSPQTKFKESDKKGGNRYPNNESAEHVVRHIQGGGRAWDLDNAENRKFKDPDTGEIKGHSGYPENFVKAGRAFEMHQKGIPMSEWRNLPSKSNPEGSSMFDSAPKTSPYHNSWLDTQPHFLVSDVHTGGGAFVPHLGTDKPILEDTETGELKRNRTGSGFQTGKSEREKVIESKGFHAMADFAARRALERRGLTSIRQAQAAQWSEERIHRTLHDTNLKNPLETEETAYAGRTPKPKPPRPEDHGQLSLFKDRRSK